jgi:hypothetical protein
MNKQLFYVCARFNRIMDNELSSSSHEFPMPPDNVHEASVEVLSRFISQFNEWRNHLINDLDHPSKLASLVPSIRAVSFFQLLLNTTWPEDLTEFAIRSPYNIFPFPDVTHFAKKFGLDKAKSIVINILKWRASLVDMLSDMWDVIGEPTLDLDKCRFIENLIPRNIEGRCIFCLAKFEDATNHESHSCIVAEHIRAKWSDEPF